MSNYCNYCEREYKNIMRHYNTNKHLDTMFYKSWIKEVERGNLYPELNKEQRKNVIENGNLILGTIKNGEGEERIEFRGKSAYSQVCKYKNWV